MSELFFAPCPRGLEPALATELAALRASGIVPGEGGVAFEGEIGLAYHANLESRIASRILWRVASAPYRNERDLHAFVHGIDWPRYFKPERTLRVDIAATRSPVASLEFATLRVKDAICDRFRDECGTRPSIDKRTPDVRVHAYLTEREATIYLDTSGEPLFKRGWRLDKGAAPLRENLAAGILRVAGWVPGTPLYDPMCGSGTFIAEAAQIALGVAPGVERRFGFEKLKQYDVSAWQTMKVAALDAKRAAAATRAELPIFGSDISGDMLEKARANLARAGVPGLWLKQLDARAMVPPSEQPGIVIANPPYGERIEVRGPRGDLREPRHAAREPGAEAFSRAQPDDTDSEFFRAFGDALKQRFTLWRAFVLTADRSLPGQMRLRESAKTPLFNGALECRLFRFDLVSGSVKPRPAPRPTEDGAGQ